MQNQNVREKQKSCQKMMLDLATCEGMMICMSATCLQSQSKKQVIKNHKVKTMYITSLNSLSIPINELYNYLYSLIK